LSTKLLDRHTAIVSAPLLAKLADILSRDKFAVTNSQSALFISSLVHMSKIVPDTLEYKVVLEDPDDDVVLNTAYNGSAEYIVAGDRHLSDFL